MTMIYFATTIYTYHPNSHLIVQLAVLPWFVTTSHLHDICGYHNLLSGDQDGLVHHHRVSRIPIIFLENLISIDIIFLSWPSIFDTLSPQSFPLSYVSRTYLLSILHMPYIVTAHSFMTDASLMFAVLSSMLRILRLKIPRTM
jgi:hypothetical protein